MLGEKNSMRTKKYLVNMLYSVFFSLFTMLLSLATRRLFVKLLDYEYLGYENLFADIFTLMSVTELGFDVIISYHLYREMASGNKDNISRLMSVYKCICLLAGLGILILGTAIYPWVDKWVAPRITNIVYARITYFSQLLIVALSYFLEYKRTMFIADQKAYICVKGDTYFNFITQIIQFFLLYYTHNYCIYIIIKLIKPIGANLFISLYYRKMYGFVHKVKVTRKIITDFHIWKDIKGFLVHKISYVIYGGTDNIIIMFLKGIKNVTLYGNYTLLQGMSSTFLDKFYSPMRSLIGNLVNENLEYACLWFKRFDIIAQFIGTFILIFYAVLFEPFIIMWLGADFLLPFSFVLALAYKQYLIWGFELLYYYRSSQGDYDYDKKYLIWAAVSNIIGSIILGKVCGITGIALATLFAQCIIVLGRIRFVHIILLRQSVSKYLLRHFGYLLISSGALILAVICSSKLEITVLGIMERVGIVIFATVISNGLLFIRNHDFYECIRFFARFVGEQFHLLNERGAAK